MDREREYDKAKREAASELIENHKAEYEALLAKHLGPKRHRKVERAVS